MLGSKVVFYALSVAYFLTALFYLNIFRLRRLRSRLPPPPGEMRRPSGPRPVNPYAAPELNPAPPGQDTVQKALALLSQSPSGAPIVGYLRDLHIAIEQLETPVARAMYSPETRTIYLCQMATVSVTEVACLLVHEGLHAVQDLVWRLEPCLEREYEAYFLQYAVYHELLDAGCPRLPEESSFDGRYRIFCHDARRMDMRRFQESVLAGSKEAHEADMIGRMSRAASLSELQRAEIVAWHARRNFEPLAGQLGNPRKIFRRSALRRTERLHAERETWERKWIEEHRATLTLRDELGHPL